MDKGNIFNYRGSQDNELLHRWLRSRRYNGHSLGFKDKTGAMIFGLSWIYGDGDWAKLDKRGLVRFPNHKQWDDSLLEPKRIIEEHYSQVTLG